VTGVALGDTSYQYSLISLLEQITGCGGIVAYHGIRDSSLLPSTHVSPHAFQAHMEFLAGSYHVLPLTEFVARRRRHRSLRRCVSVTFDDAYLGVLTHGLPVLERLGLPATVFVATGYCRPAERFWWDRLEWLSGRLDAAAAADLLAQAGLPPNAASHQVRDHLLSESHGAVPRRLETAMRRAERQVGAVAERAMTEEELLRLARSDLMDFGCHTVHHYSLPTLAADKVEREIQRSHRWLADRLPRVRPYLAYPYGLYTRATVAAARRCGMEAAFSIEGRAATSRFPLHYCSRIGMADVNRVEGLRLRLAWITIPLVAMRNKGWHPRIRRPGAWSGHSPS
jgi:peptidoglycan/xylan/chitin deacetylase (PgdA/CDA1 family)